MDPHAKRKAGCPRGGYRGLAHAARSTRTGGRAIICVSETAPRSRLTGHAPPSILPRRMVYRLYSAMARWYNYLVGRGVRGRTGTVHTQRTEFQCKIWPLFAQVCTHIGFIFCSNNLLLYFTGQKPKTQTLLLRRIGTCVSDYVGARHWRCSRVTTSRRVEA